MRHRDRQKRRRNGFTLIEVVAVLVILGIIAAVTIARMGSTSTYDLSSQVDVVKNHLRLAQARAMNSGDDWGIFFASSTTYYLFHGSGSTTPVSLPGEGDTTVNLVTKKSALTISSAPLRITFDKYGSPGTTTVTVNTNGGNFTVAKNTGFIP